MKWKIFSTTTVLLAALSLVSSADARTNRSRTRDAQMQHRKTDHGVGKGQGYGKETDEMDMGYSAPARIHCTGAWDVFVSGSFIYWLASQEQMDLATWQTTDSPPITGVIEQEFKYKPGFKVALGTNFGHDNWTGMVEYTRIHFSTVTNSAPPQTPSAGTLVVNQGWTGLSFFGEGVLLNQLSTKWKCNLDVVDAELARWYYSGRMLTFGPFFGPRFGWLKERMNYTAFVLDQDPTLGITNTVRSSSWFLGPRTGLDANYVLGWGFRLTGTVAGSLLYQRQKVRASLTDILTEAEALKLRDTFRLVRPNTELGLGLGWGSYFMEESWHFDIMAAYEFHYWWNQNVMRAGMLRNQNAITSAVPIKPGDLSYHGLNLTLRLDF